MRIIVAGGGVAGLGLAHGLTKYGVDVVAFESRPDLTTSGYRLHMNADGGAALRFLLTPSAFTAYEQTSRRNPRRHVLAMVDQHLNEVAARPHIGPPNDRLVPHTAVNRLTLRQILASGLGDSLQFGARVEGFAEDADGVTVRLTDGTEVRGDVLVAADGMRSQVRRQLLGAPVLRDSGEATLYSRVSFSMLGDLDLPPVLDDGFVLAADPAGHELTFGPFAPRRPIREVQRDLLADTELTDVDPYLQVTVSAPATGPNAYEGGSIFDASPEQIHEYMRCQVRDWSPTVRDIVDRVEIESISAVPIRGIETTPAWESSRVTVVGDAIHGMPPTFGAGANTALKDAAYLLEHLLRVIDGAELLQEISAYEAEMRAYSYPIANAAHEPAARRDAEFMPQAVA